MAPVKIPKAHRVVDRLAGGRVAIYWYRRRGAKPALIIFTGDDMAAALAAERAGAEAIVAAFGASGARIPDEPATVRDLVTRFKAAPDGFLKLRAGKRSTRGKWAPWLDRIVGEFGDLPIAALPHKAVKRDIIAWRNRCAGVMEDADGGLVVAHPRTGDYAIQVIRRLFAWAVENELAEANPADGIKGLYSASRADVVVEPAELAEVMAAATPAGRDAIALDALTGLRLGDLVDVTWPEIGAGDDYIERSASKSTTGRRILVPLVGDARALVARLRAENKARKVPSIYVLTTHRGTNWTESGLGVTWHRAAKAAGVDKHFNDLRGTACTNFYLTVPGLSDEEAADIMGWEPARCRAIRKRYVDPARIAAGIVGRMAALETARPDG